MQIFGISSLLCCVLTMFLIYIGSTAIAVWLFGLALVLLIISLALLIREIQISAQALQYHIADIEQYLKENSIENLNFIYFDFPDWILNILKSGSKKNIFLNKKPSIPYLYYFFWHIGIYFATKSIV